MQTFIGVCVCVKSEITASNKIINTIYFAQT